MVRYSDDSIYHCRSEEEARKLKETLKRRLKECGLEINEGKTKIEYCKDYRRRKNYPKKSFDFLGYTFKPTTKKGRNLFPVYDAGISRERVKEEIRRGIEEKEVS